MPRMTTNQFLTIILVALMTANLTIVLVTGKSAPATTITNLLSGAVIIALLMLVPKNERTNKFGLLLLVKINAVTLFMTIINGVVS